MGTVWVPTKSGATDLSDLEKYGKIEYISMSHIFPDNADRSEDWCETVSARLDRFDPDNDYIALMGDTAVCAIAIADLAGRGYGQIYTLKWDRKNQNYYEFKILTR